jgi:hypothetical protein
VEQRQRPNKKKSGIVPTRGEHKENGIQSELFKQAGSGGGSNSFITSR